MRGTYNFTREDRCKFFLCFRDLVGDQKRERVQLTGANISLYDCEKALEELGYEQYDTDTNGWEMDFWWFFCAEGLPDIYVGGCSYTGDLYIQFEDEEYEAPDFEAKVEKLKETMNTNWLKYGLVV